MLSVLHRTTYIYGGPVQLGPHRLLLRPREGRDVWLSSFSLEITPVATMHWGQDLWGNAAATAEFSAPTDRLTIESRATLDLRGEAWPIFDIAVSAMSYPFSYTDADRIDLGALIQPQYEDRGGRLADWAQAFVAATPTDTLSLLKDMCAGISKWVFYQSRDAEGTQSPMETLDRGWGSCRDYAILLAEAVRSLGFAARIVSGYLYDPDKELRGFIDGGSTHAWTEIYVPNAGWIVFDPTNNRVGGHNLIPVAVGRDIWQVSPVSGNYTSINPTFSEMSVEIEIVPA